MIASNLVRLQLWLATGSCDDATDAGAGVKEKSQKLWQQGANFFLWLNKKNKVRTDPRMVAQLRTTFLKLAAAMEGAMVRKKNGLSEKVGTN